MKYTAITIAAATLLLCSCGSKGKAADAPVQEVEAVETVETVETVGVVEPVEPVETEPEPEAIDPLAAVSDSLLDIARQLGGITALDSAVSQNSSSPASTQDMINSMTGMLGAMMGQDGQQANPDEIMSTAMQMLGEIAQQRRAHQEEIRKKLPKGWQDWEAQDVSGIYVKLNAWDEDEAARISRDYYDGGYISDGWSYYARTSLMAGQYPITLGRAETSLLYHIQGSEYYIYFDWLADVNTGDEGVYDNTGFFRYFYKKPRR